MIPIASSTFRNDQGEAVRLPQEVAFGAEIEVVIERSGNALTIRPRQEAEADQQQLARMMGALDAMRLPRRVSPTPVTLARDDNLSHG